MHVDDVSLVDVVVLDKAVLARGRVLIMGRHEVAFTIKVGLEGSALIGEGWRVEAVFVEECLFPFRTKWFFVPLINLFVYLRRHFIRRFFELFEVVCFCVGVVSGSDIVVGVVGGVDGVVSAVVNIAAEVVVCVFNVPFRTKRRRVCEIVFECVVSNVIVRWSVKGFVTNVVVVVFEVFIIVVIAGWLHQVLNALLFNGLEKSAMS